MEKNHHNSFLTTGKSCRSNVCRPHLIGQFQNFKDQRLVLATQDCGAKKNEHGAQYGWDEVESKSSCIDDGYVHAWDPVETF